MARLMAPSCCALDGQGARRKCCASTQRLSGPTTRWSRARSFTSHFATFWLCAASPEQQLDFRPLPEGHTAFIYILAGRVMVADMAADAHHCMVLSSACGEDGTWVAGFISWSQGRAFAENQGVTVCTGSCEGSFLLCAAAPLREPVVWQGPFAPCQRASWWRHFQPAAGRDI